jgi:ribosomal protein S1
LFLSHKADTIFIPMGNVAWQSTAATIAAFQPGQKLRVLVERLNYKTKIYAGSMKNLDPESNPYRELSRNDPERVYTGNVKMVHHDGVVIDLGNGCVGDLPLTDETKTLETGSQVDVQIAALEVDAQKLDLKLAPSPSIE